MGRTKKVLKWAALVIGGLILAIGVALVVAHEERPEGARQGADAEALASRIERAVNVDAWAETGAVRYVICAVGRDAGEFLFTPFGHLADGNPYEAYRPPEP